MRAVRRRHGLRGRVRGRRAERLREAVAREGRRRRSRLEDDEVPRRVLPRGVAGRSTARARAYRCRATKRWLQGRFERGALRGEARLSTPDPWGLDFCGTMGEFGDDGAFGGVGTTCDRSGGRLTANRRGGDVAAGLAVWEEPDDSRGFRRESTAVVAWTRESFGDAERRAETPSGEWTDLVARGAVVVRFVTVDTSMKRVAVIDPRCANFYAL